MNELSEELMSLNEEIVQVLSNLSKFKPRFYHSFAKSELNKYASSLVSFREHLNKIDQELRPHTYIPSDYNSIQMVAGRLSIIFPIRNLALTTLGEAQKLLNSHESEAGFKLSTNLAFLAIVISVIGVVAG